MKKHRYLPYAVSREQIQAFRRLSVADRLRFVEDMARLLLAVRNPKPSRAPKTNEPRGKP